MAEGPGPQNRIGFRIKLCPSIPCTRTRPNFPTLNRYKKRFIGMIMQYCRRDPPVLELFAVFLEAAGSFQEFDAGFGYISRPTRSIKRQQRHAEGRRTAQRGKQSNSCRHTLVILWLLSRIICRQAGAVQFI